MLCNNFLIGLQATLQPQNNAFSLKKTASGGLQITSETAGTRLIIFTIKSYPCMPKTGSHSIQGMADHSGQTRKWPWRPQNDLGGCSFRTNMQTALGVFKMTSEAAGTRPIIFSIKSCPCRPKTGSHSIQGMTNHSGQTRKWSQAASK